MSKFTFYDNIRPFSVYKYNSETKEETLFKTYKIVVGGEDGLKELMKKKEKIMAFTENDYEDIEKVVDFMRDLINPFFNNEFEVIYKDVAGKNVKRMSQFVFFFINEYAEYVKEQEGEA